MLATPNMGSSMVFLAYLGLFVTVIGALACYGGRYLWKAGHPTEDNADHHVVVGRLGWGAAVMGIGATMAILGLVMLVLLALVLLQ